LVLRAAAGDCIEVTLTNRLSTTTFQPSRPGAEKALSSINIQTSLQVGLHPQQVGMDILAGNGVNIGLNPPQTIAPSQSIAHPESKKLTWYAGSIAIDGKYTPVELGAIGLSPADPLMQHPFGLLGALVIEPAGATWVEDSNGRSQATVQLPSAKQFREFVLVIQDDVESLMLSGLSYTPITFSQATADRSLLQNSALELPDTYSRAVNYRTEPLSYRYNMAPGFGATDPKLAPLGIARALSNSQVLGDPQTPVLAVSKGMATRLRVVHPGGLSEQVFTLAGHPWQEEPFRNNSQEIGDNPASQWFGSRDAFGANDQFNIILKSAGGSKQVTGDYLYRTFIGSEFQFGIWGVMRVGEPGSDIVTVTRVANDKRGWGYIISGVNTVNPSSGKMAANVTITASVIAPNTRNAKPVTCTVPVDRVTGEWNTDQCQFAAQGVLVVGAGRPITVVSEERGRVAVNGFVPSVAPPPVTGQELVEAIEHLRSEVVDAATQQGRKEIIQFKGERTPAATVGPVRPARVDAIPSHGAGTPVAPTSSDEGLLQAPTPPATVRPDH
jgi:hypothetical protein